MTDKPRPLRRAAFGFVFITVLLDMLALGIIIPVLPKLVLEFVGGDAAKSADWLGIFGTAWALMQFLFSPIHGALSDRFGRRPMILLSNFGLGLDCILMALAPTLTWLFVGRVISGITAASLATSYAYVADVAEPDRRAGLFGLLGVAFGAGFVLGPALGGIAGSVDPRLPFWIAAALSLLNGMYGLLILPESLPPEKRAPFKWRLANPVGSLVLWRSHPQLLALAVVTFLEQLAHASLPNMGVLYMMYRYAWAEHAVGLVMALVGLCSMVVQGVLIAPAVKHLGESRAMIVGLTFGVLGFATFGLAATGFWFLAGIPLLALWGIGNAATMGLMSRRVDASEQGQLQGANASLMGIASLIGPAIFTQSFAWSIAPGAPVYLPGAPFLLSAVLVAAAIAVAANTMRKSKKAEGG
jgi:DHA1 family tetracycline resistance protein-like MFS transporter